MKTSSAKAKGRVCCSLVKDLLYQYAPDLKPGDIEITSSGATGEDLKLSPAARQKYPLIIECKNTEAINIWAAFEQAKGHLVDKDLDSGFHVPIVFYRRNRSDLMCTLLAEDFLKLIV